MRLAGNIEDLGLGEILQIISFSGKSGVLRLNSRGREGKIVFRTGQVVSSSSSTIKGNIGALLLKANLINKEQLSEACEHQNAGNYAENLGTVLINNFQLTSEQVDEAAKKQIQQVIFSFFLWYDGSFTFELGDFSETTDSVREDPLNYVLDTGLNPQFIAMEGARLSDEYLKDGGVGRQEPEPEDEEIDLGELSFETIVPDKSAADVEAEDARFSMKDVLRELEQDSDFLVIGAPAPRVETSKGLKILKEMLDELSKPLSMNDITLLILRLSSEIMNRAVVFAVKRGNIVGLGQFGIEIEGVDSDKRIRNMKIPLDESSVLRDAIECKDIRVRKPDNLPWNEYLINELGGMAPHEAFVAPVVVQDRVALIIYGDNVPEDREIGDTSTLEIFLSQATVALERIILEKKLSSRKEPTVA